MKQTTNFHRFYIDPDVDFGTYENVVVRPVDTSHIEKQTWYDVTYNDKELAEIIEVIEKEFARTLGASYLVVNDGGGFTGKTLVLETSLIDLDPVDKYSNVMSSALIYIPVSKGKVAMEGRMIDADTRKTVLKFADARHGKQNVGNVKDYAKFMHAKDVINEWATEVHGIMQMGQAEREGYFSGTFELKPWK